MTLPSTCMTFSRSVANNRILKISGYHYLMFSRRLSTNQAKKEKKANQKDYSTPNPFFHLRCQRSHPCERHGGGPSPLNLSLLRIHCSRRFHPWTCGISSVGTRAWHLCRWCRFLGIDGAGRSMPTGEKNVEGFQTQATERPEA